MRGQPTNHLDVHALVWLEQWLLHHYEGITLVVSHDHYFLDAICTDILELKSTLAGHSKSSREHFSGECGFLRAVALIYSLLVAVFLSCLIFKSVSLLSFLRRTVTDNLRVRLAFRQTRSYR